MNQNFIKKISAILSGTILLESCSEGYIINNSAEEINEYIEKYGRTRSSCALPINLNLKQEDKEYLLFIGHLANQIIEDPSVAQSFASNPSDYIKSFGFRESSISIDANLTKLILALGDKDVSSAIKSGNIKRYVNLMSKRKYFGSFISKNALTEISQIIDEEQIHNSLTHKLESPIDVQCGYLFFYVAVVVGVAACVWAVVIEHFGGVNAVGYATVVYSKVGVVSDGKSSTSQGLDSLIDSNIIKVWNIKSQDSESTLMLTNKLKEEVVESAMKYIKAKLPHEIERYGETSIKNTIIANLNYFAHE